MKTASLSQEHIDMLKQSIRDGLPDDQPAIPGSLADMLLRASGIQVYWEDADAPAPEAVDPPEVEPDEEAPDLDEDAK